MSYTLDENGAPISADESPAAPVRWTADDVSRLKRAIAAAGNAKQVSYADGRGVSYLAVAEAAKLLAMMEADVKAGAEPEVILDPLRRPVRAFRVGYRSGY